TFSQARLAPSFYRSSGMRCIAGKRATRISALVLLATCLPAGAWAAPAVTFDVAQTARCYPVTTAECLSRPAGNVVEVVLDISCRLISGEEKELKSITYEIRNP